MDEWIEDHVKLNDVVLFKNFLLSLSNQYSKFILLEDGTSNGSFDFMAAWGNFAEVEYYDSEKKSGFSKLEKAIRKNSGPWFGVLGYDLKNEIEKLESSNKDFFEAPGLAMFLPEIYVKVKGGEAYIFHHGDHQKELLFSGFKDFKETRVEIEKINFIPSIERKNYLEKIDEIQRLIVEGDFYELNFCQAYFAEMKIDFIEFYKRLSSRSKAPFSGFFKWNEHILCCASPERFLSKKGKKLCSQPIKGTIKRGRNTEEDKMLSEYLRNSEKNIAENVMIVDLVRNDFSRVCEVGTVKVPELFKVYSFPGYHQMISTVEGVLSSKHTGIDALRACFPMGSMTGAPKIRAMERIEELEKTKRGWYSGALGYIDQNGDFDFNVVIRSLIGNTNKELIGFQVGGAIVYDSVAEEEYEECKIKAGNILKCFD
jgi:para-aminobenzoate synthetase component I